MIAQSDAFISLPGGLGTFDEMFEVMTLRQLSYHSKPVGLLDKLLG
jgi:predicted Rossmann-fold nucleotide-binding protein